MRYYIPTTTLNFNNILSSESVSPSAFFEKRGFGYSRWFEIPENEKSNFILLYDKLSRVERGNSELEDHPMIIEITTDEPFPEIGKGIYVSDKTIYLTPWNTKFIFLTEQEKRIALSLSDSSLETKMIRLYQRGFEVRNADGAYPHIDKVSEDLNNSEIYHDRVINRLKGLLYGYYIGALLSSDESTVQYYNVLKELQNHFAAILSSPYRESTAEQERKVNTLIKSLLFHTPVFKRIETIVGDREKGNREKTIEIVNVFTIYGKSLYNFTPSWFFNELRYGELDDNKALKWVSTELSNLNALTNKNLLSPEKGEIVVLENTLNSIKENVIPDKTENHLFIGLINYILTDDSINGKVSSQRAELTDTLTVQVRDLLGNQWETSPIRAFLNQLRKHVRGDEFNQEWNNGVLSSLAAVILKGDDWEVLLDFMKRKGMTDYRLAFAFYGVFNGFANLTRDFTDLLLNNDRIYVAEIYRNFHRSLHNESIEINPSVLDRQPIIEQNEEPKTIEDESELDFKKRVLDFFNSKVRKNKRNQTELEEELQCALSELGPNPNGYLLVSVLNEYPTWKRKKSAWEEMQQEFCSEYESKINTKKKVHDSLEKETKSSKSLIDKIKDTIGGVLPGFGFEDDSTRSQTHSFEVGYQEREKKISPKIHFNSQNINLILDLIKVLNPNLNDFALKHIYNDLNWVFSPQYSRGKTELELLESFRITLTSGKDEPFSKKGNDMKWKNNAYRFLDIDKTIQTLKDNIEN